MSIILNYFKYSTIFIEEFKTSCVSLKQHHPLFYPVPCVIQHTARLTSMSEQKLTNYLNKSTFSTPIGPRHHIPVILSDSKGIYLKNNIIHPFDNNIVWWCKGGSTIEQSLAWLKRNINAKLRTLGPIRLYIWLGTCTLTGKGKTPHIALTSNNDDSVYHIIRNLNNFKDFLANYHQVQVTFLEIPVYSILI